MQHRLRYALRQVDGALMPTKGNPWGEIREPRPRGNPPNKGSGGVRDNELRIRGSLELHLGVSPTEPEVIEALVRKARLMHGVIVFTPGDLERMPDMARALIEGEHERICGRSGR